MASKRLREDEAKEDVDVHVSEQESSPFYVYVCYFGHGDALSAFYIKTHPGAEKLMEMCGNVPSWRIEYDDDHNQCTAFLRRYKMDRQSDWEDIFEDMFNENGFSDAYDFIYTTSDKFTPSVAWDRTNLYHPIHDPLPSSSSSDDG